MNKFAVDYSSLEKRLEQKKAYYLKDVKDKIEKVAFDIVRFRDSDGDEVKGLWQINQGPDGEYIVATYEEDNSEMVVEASAPSDWKALSDKTGSFVNVFYKEEPVAKISVASLGIPESETFLMVRYLPERLASNKNLVNSLLGSMPEEQRYELVNKYPELNK